VKLCVGGIHAFQCPDWQHTEHFSFNHSVSEYARGSAHIRKIVGFFSIFERGIKDMYQLSSEQNLRRYYANSISVVQTASIWVFTMPPEPRLLLKTLWISV